MKTKTLLTLLSKKYPKRIAKKWHDTVGLMAGTLPNEIHKILLCLDFDEEVYETAIKEKPDIIFSHHPFIYTNKKKVFESDPKKESLYLKVLDNSLCVYSWHTNFDEGIDGMNDALSNALGLTNVYKCPNTEIMRIGYFENEKSIEEVVKLAKKKFDVPYGELIFSNPKMIKKVGIIGGGGGSFWKTAMEEECDLYISGDIPHHARRDIVRYKFNYLDLPHEIERIFMPQMKKVLLKIDPTLNIVIVDHEKCPKNV